MDADLSSIDPNLGDSASAADPLSPSDALTQQLQGSLDSDTADYTKLVQQNKPDQFTQQSPQRDVSIMNRMPYLLGLVALGGKFGKLHGQTMLAATNAMVKGTIQGNQQAYAEAEKKYDDAYQRWLDKWKVQQQLFNEMRQVYKGRIDADLKALEFARKATNDTWSQNFKEQQAQTKNFLDSQKVAAQLQDIQSKISARDLEQGQLLDPDTLATAVDAVMIDPNAMRQYVPTMGKAGMPVRNQINQGVAKRMKELGLQPGDLSQIRARAKAEGQSIGKLTQQLHTLNAADELVKANGDRLLQLFDLVDETGVPLVEGVTRSARAKAGGVDVAELSSVMNTFRNEVARIIGGNPNMTGVVSVHSQQEVEKMAPDNMSADQARRVIERLYTEIAIAKQAREDEIQKASVSMTPGAPAAAPSTPSGPQEGAKSTSKSGKPIVFHNGRWEYVSG